MSNKLRADVLRRFEALTTLQATIQFHRVQTGATYAEPQSFQKWTIAAMSLLKDVFGESSVHFKQFEVINAKFERRQSNVLSLFGIIEGAKHDFDNNFVSPEIQISGEILGDFVLLAKALLQEGHKDAASVLACAALEDALKRYAVSKGLAVNDNDLEGTINALKSGGLVQGFDKKYLDSTPKIRNAAMHADWEKISPESVNTVLAFVEQFLLRGNGDRYNYDQT